MQINYRDKKTGRWVKRGIERLEFAYSLGDKLFLGGNVEIAEKINDLIDAVNSLTSKEEKKEEYLTDSKGNKWVATFGSAHDPHNPFPLKSEPKQECDHKDEDGYSYKCNYREVGENFKFCPLCGAKL